MWCSGAAVAEAVTVGRWTRMVRIWGRGFARQFERGRRLSKQDKRGHGGRATGAAERFQHGYSSTACFAE